MDNEFLILLQAGLDEAASKGLINDDIKNKLQGKINQLQLTAVIDDNSISAIKGQLEKILNHSITISNINIDTGQAAKNAQQAGQKIGDALNQGISSNIKNIKENIASTVKEIHSLDANDIIKKLNLNRASVGNEVVGQVRLLVSEINNLGREAAKTNSDSAWEQLIGKCSKLGNILDTFGKTRSFPGMDDIKRFADYFNGKIIDVGYKNSGLSGTDFTASQLNKDLKDLSVKFVAAKQGAIELDTIWEEMCNTTGRMDLLNITNAQEQIQTVINELLKAQSIIHGEKGLIAHPNAHGDLSKYLQEVEQARNTVINLQNEKSALMQKESQEATTAANTIIQNEERKQQAYRETANAYKNISPNESIVKSGAGILTFEGTNNAAKESQQYFRNLLKDEQAVIATTEQFGKNNNLTSFAVNIKRASGEVESLKYTIDALKDDKGNIEQIFYKLSGSSINDSGAIKQIKAIENAFASFTQKIEQFKSTNSGKLSGLTLPLSDFESKLSGLKNGTNTIDEVRNAFKLLQAEASKIDAPLKRQLSTFDSYKNAIDKGKESISGYRAELKGLANAPKELSQELTKASKLLLQLNRTEATEGTTVNWSNQAREFVDLLTNIENKISVIKKEQSNAATTQIFNTKDLDAQGKIYIQKVSNTIEKTKSELESKLRNAGYVDIQIKGIEDANGKIKSLTANVTDATGAFKQLNFERAKIQNQGKAQSGFIQTDDVKVIGNISDSVHTVQSSLTALKTKWKEQGILVGEFKSKVEQLESSFVSVGSKGELNSLKTQIQTLKNEASTLIQSNKIQLSIDTGGYEAKVEGLISKTRQWTDEFGNSRINTDALSKALKNLGDASTTLSNNNTVENQRALVNAEKELDTQIQKVTNSIRTMNFETMKSSAVDSLRQKYQEFYDKNGAAHRQWGTRLKQAMLELASGAKISKQRGEELRQELIQIQNAARQAGKLGKSGLQKLFEGFKSFSYWTSPTFLVMKAIQEVRKSVTSVKELDTALVDLKKTTTMTAEELEEFYYASNDVAKQMGVSTEEIINQAAAWSRLGFSSNEVATKMAQLSSKFASISPGMSTDEAQEGLVSIIKANIYAFMYRNMHTKNI